jgi:hypothetical protein
MLAIDWTTWESIAAVVTAAVTLIGIPAGLVRFWLPRRGFRVGTEIDKSLQTRIRVNLRGETARSIQDVHLAVRRSIVYRAVHDQSKIRDRRPVRIEARPSPHNPQLPTKVADRRDRVFVFDVLGPTGLLESRLPPRSARTKGWETRAPEQGEIRVFFRGDAKGGYLIKPKAVEGLFE